MPEFLVRLRSTRSMPLTFAMGLAIAVGACSGSAAQPASGSGSASAGSQVLASAAATGGDAAACVGAGLTFCGHIKITGGISREADFVSGFFVNSCTDWLKGNKDDATLLTLPIARVADIVTDTVIQGYKGPGAYDIADLAGSLGGFQVAVVHDRFVADSDTVGSATLAADGSGSVTATGMQPAGDSNQVQQPVDVTFTWTCFTK